MHLTNSRLFLFLTLLVVQSAAGDDWTQFRGPGGLGRSTAKGLPVSWSSTENIVWRTKLPGPGTSSPIVLGERVYLTCYAGYGLVPNEGDMKNLRRLVVCLDRETGDLLWERHFEPVLPESRYRGGNSSWHGYASSTPTTDGERLYVFFGKSGVYALDLNGKERWNKRVGSGTDSWGSANSPILYRDLVIVNASVESNSLVAFKKATGDEVWRAGNIHRSWNTPVLVDVPGKDTELVVCDEENVLGFDPATGEELWRVTGFGRYVCPSVVANDGIVYVVRNEALAIRAGGRGDVTETHVLWRARGRSVVPSPVFHAGHIYWIPGARSMAYCLDATSGDTVYQERLSPQSGGKIYASVLAADDKLYCVTQHDGIYVLAANPQFEQLAHNVFADDNSRTNASPIAVDGKIFLRTDRFLYCIGE